MGLDSGTDTECKSSQTQRGIAPPRKHAVHAMLENTSRDMLLTNQGLKHSHRARLQYFKRFTRCANGRATHPGDCGA